MIRSILHFIIAAMLCLTVLSCKKAEETTTSSENGTPAPSSKVKPLTTDKWKIIGERLKYQFINATGGSYFTVAFNNHHNEDELRWYTWFKTSVNNLDHHEMIIDKNGKVTSTDVVNLKSKGGEFKIVNNNNVWKINRSLDNAKVIHVFKNNEEHPHDNRRDGRSSIDQLSSVNDGLFTFSTSLISNNVSHFNVNTEIWKRNAFSGNNFLPIRHNNLTFVIAFSNFSDASIIRILKESNTRNEYPIPGLPNVKDVSYPMDIIKDIQLRYTGILIHNARYGDHVFLALMNFKAQGRMGIFKWHLTDHTVTLVNEFALTSPSDVSKSSTNVPYIHATWDIDDAGNFYVVEQRSESGKGRFSIRKFKVAGGSEVLLKEEDLILATQINGIKYFNGKLHAAISYNELIPDENPNDFNFKYNFHLQIISPK
jgi:hypothetical protein